jgi:hypothetical protein
MVPIHLGLIDRPFVPHNPIPAQESPVPLLKFQMAPRLKIWMSSGSRYTILFYPKSPGKQIPSRFPSWAPMERDTCLQSIFAYILIYLFITKGLWKESIHDPQKQGPYGNRLLSGMQQHTSNKKVCKKNSVKLSRSRAGLHSIPAG